MVDCGLHVLVAGMFPTSRCKLFLIPLMDSKQAELLSIFLWQIEGALRIFIEFWLLKVAMYSEVIV